MNILITGGAGFIGTNFVNLISKKYPDYKITVIDKLNQQGRKENLDSVKSKIDFQNFDLIQFEKLSKLFKEKEFDFVVHFAAETNVDRSIENPLEFVNSNVVATQNLLSLSQNITLNVFITFLLMKFWRAPLDPQLNLMKTRRPRSPYSATAAGSDHPSEPTSTPTDCRLQ
jgi:dTDP-glucose 4,6-dehydratase